MTGTFLLEGEARNNHMPTDESQSITGDEPVQNESACDNNNHWDGVDRIVALGDIHGDYNRYMEALVRAGLVDDAGDWAGGDTHFVQIGDIPDRGPESARVIRHMQVLEKQAQLAGGRVHALVGNHEAMNICGQLHYVHPGEYQAMRSDEAETLREAYYQSVREDPQRKPVRSLYDYASRHTRRHRLDVPLGYVEHRHCWAPDGEFGSWVAGHNTVIKLNNLLFVHAGISPKYLGWSMRDINDRVRAELRNTELFEDPIIEDNRGPLWYRGLAQEEEAAAPAFVDVLLEAYGVDHVVVGHTPCYETIVPRYDGRVLVIDSGISSFYDGALTVLIVEEGKLYNLQEGQRLAIPTDEESLLDYYRAVVALEPDSVSLREMVSSLEIRVCGPG